MVEEICVEVVYAAEHSQIIRATKVAVGSTVQQAIASAKIVEDFPTLNFQTLSVGIWNKKVSLATCVQAGDRVEIYRPLKCDPKQARRKRAQAKIRR
jgi:putative ubiquitin-RnfH superfamily antitoxin RatB of RatAB toxin-antitoxin module